MGNVNENRLNLTYSAADIALMKANANSTISKVPAGATLTPEERAVNQNDIDVDNKIFVEINTMTICVLINRNQKKSVILSDAFCKFIN